MDRRQFLVAAGGVTGGLAGCLDSSDSDGSEEQWASGGGDGEVDQSGANASEVNTVSTTQEGADCSTEQETIDQAMQALADAGVEGDSLDARIAALVSERDQLQSDFDAAQGDKQAWQQRANDAAERINEACVMMYADAHAQYEFGQDKVKDVNDAYERGAYHRVVMHALDVARHFWTAGILAATVSRYQGQTPGLEVDIELTECTENAQAWYRWGREYARAGHGNVAAAASELIEAGGRPDIPDIESTIEETEWASPNELTFEYDVTAI